MTIPAPLDQLLSHPAPGLVFAPHDGARVGERAYHTPHALNPRPSWKERRALRRLTHGRDAVADLAGFYSRHNGAGLCTLWDDLNNLYVPALHLLPIRYWDEATRPYIDGDMAWAMEDSYIYRHGTWRIIAELPCEGQCLAIFFDGRCDGRDLAGQMYCLGLDGMLGYEELLAPSFSAFLEEFAADPTAWFDRIGFSWHAERDGTYWGDPPDQYIPDVRNHPSLTDWSP